ncbi:MAG: fimbrillin family protein [Prevotella sp.]|nr:fimbrillin family protein [Candidatus Prevotella equi]
MKSSILCSIFLLLSAVNTWAGSYIYRTGKGLEPSWQTNETVAITTGNMSYGVMEQLKFFVSSTPGASRNESILFATGYQLKPGMTYYAYYPYQWAAEFNAYGIACDYQSQIQDSNGNANHITKTDYQMATAIPSDNACAFSLQRIGGVMRVSFLAPATMTIAALNVKAQTPALATTATMNIINSSVTLSGYTATMTLQTQNISVEKGQEVTLYLAAPAQDLSSTTLDITLTDQNGSETLLAKIMGPNIQRGYLYDIPLNSNAKGSGASLSKASSASLSNEEPPALLAAAGVAYPTARMADIPLDPAYTVHYVPQTKKGDVNGDGDVDVLDAIEIVGYYTNGRAAELSVEVSDMNGDGEIDILDAIEIVGRYTMAK